MLETAISRRVAVLGGGALSLAGLATAALVPTPTAAAHIDAAANRCRAARQALAEALDAFERALPPPHPTLDMTQRRPIPFSWTVERRVFDGATPHRAIDFRGHPGMRYVVTEETIERDLRSCPSEDRARRRLFYRMRRRAEARAARVKALEASFRLEDRQDEVGMAERELEELTQRLFEQPAGTMAAILVQAKALSTYAATSEASHAEHQAGRYGAQLAAGLQNVARAA